MNQSSNWAVQNKGWCEWIMC